MTMVSETTDILSGTNLFTTMSSCWTAANIGATGYNTPDNTSFKVSYVCSGYKLSIVEDPELEITCKISSTRKKSNDGLYDIFCMPFGDIEVGTGTSSTFISQYTTNKELNMTALISLVSQMTQANVYDLQLLPYCPIQSIIVDTGRISKTNLTEGIDYDVLKTTDSTPVEKGIIFYVPTGNFTLNIDQQLQYDTWKKIDDYSDVVLVPADRIDMLIPYQTYLIPSLEYSTDGTDKNVNGNITITEISKISGKVLNKFTCNRLHFSLNANSTLNELKAQIYDNGYVTIKSWTTESIEDN